MNKRSIAAYFGFINDDGSRVTRPSAFRFLLAIVLAGALTYLAHRAIPVPGWVAPILFGGMLVVTSYAVRKRPSL